MKNNPKQHSVRRIVLPSGRSIEVVRFHDTDSRPQGLHVCPNCVSELVQPVAWSEASEDHWELTLECPNCWWTIDGIFDREQVHELEEQLDHGDRYAYRSTTPSATSSSAARWRAPSGPSRSLASPTSSSALDLATPSAPLASIRAHTAAACDGVRTLRRSSAASSGSRSRA